MSNHALWEISGTYYEVCNCEAVCPCRRQGGAMGGRSTYGICDFALSWRIKAGHCDDVDLANLSVVIMGSYDDDEPGSPWRIILYLDENGTEQQQKALTDIFLGHAGGTTLKNFAHNFGEVFAVRTAKIELEHDPKREQIDVKGYVSAATARGDLTDQTVSCGIPGHDRPGMEIVADHFWADDLNLKWEVNNRCGFATNFSYQS